MAEYAHVSLIEALDLPCDLFMLCYKNWYVNELRQSEQGRKYLDDCERYAQTRPDRAALHRLMKKLQN